MDCFNPFLPLFLVGILILDTSVTSFCSPILLAAGYPFLHSSSLTTQTLMPLTTRRIHSIRVFVEHTFQDISKRGKQQDNRSLALTLGFVGTLRRVDDMLILRWNNCNPIIPLFDTTKEDCVNDSVKTQINHQGALNLRSIAYTLPWHPPMRALGRVRTSQKTQLARLAEGDHVGRVPGLHSCRIVCQTLGVTWRTWATWAGTYHCTLKKKGGGGRVRPGERHTPRQFPFFEL